MHSKGNSMGAEDSVEFTRENHQSKFEHLTVLATHHVLFTSK